MVSTYTAADIQILSGLDPIRKRPGMYIGGVDSAAMHHVFWEVVGNAIDEHRRGFATRIDITFDGDFVTIEDDGRGVPPSALEVVMTSLHGCPDPSYGVVIANALAREFEARVWRDGRASRQRFAAGRVIGSVEDLGPTSRTGTSIRFAPDFTILDRSRWNIDAVAVRCRELAALLPGLELSVDGERFRYGAMLEHVQHLAGCELFEPFVMHVEEKDIVVDLAIAWTDRAALRTFTNCGPTSKGTHVDALDAALRTLLGRHYKRAHAIVMMHVQLAEPRFRQQTREWLTNEEVGVVVQNAVEYQLAKHFEQAPALLDSILIACETRRHAARPSDRPRSPRKKNRRRPASAEAR